MIFALFLLLFAAIAWFLTEAVLRGDNLDRYDGPKLTPINAGAPPSAAHHDVVANLTNLFTGTQGEGNRLTAIRGAMERMGETVDLTDIELHEVVADGVKAEWVLAPNSARDRRLLYIHGGAFTAGSPKSHRPITTALARRLGVSVLAVDYRLMPENRRQDGIDDCHKAYRWILINGPLCWHPVESLCVAGDSAGGNLALNTIAWARDLGIRLPEATVAIAPATDATFSSPSIRNNLDTDPLLGPALRQVVAAPQSLLLWFGWLNGRISPAHPAVSPVRGDLHGLPPTLIHASEAEILRDDAYRYYYKALAADSPVTLETWEHVVHVWHIFEPQLPEAQQAFEHITRYVEERLNVASKDAEQEAA